MTAANCDVGGLARETGRPKNDVLERVLDVSFSAAGLAFLMPILVVIAALIWISDGGPPIYRQRRIGQSARTFECLKFRSMCMDSGAQLAAHLAANPAAQTEWALTQKLRNDPRITPIGHFIRRTSLDELPQLWNVLRGQMSLVGPRPIVAAEIKRYGRYFECYCQAKPGLTGLWQVSGRNDTSYRRRVAMDVIYAKRRSLGLYLQLILATIPAVLTKKGAV
jgi:exopolysaccharide production protein ExoY